MKPRIKVRPEVAGLVWLLPAKTELAPIMATPAMMRDLPAYADTLTRLGAVLTLRNLRDCIYIN